MHQVKCRLRYILLQCGMSCFIPGPWPTFEIQLPQDDFHLLAWQLGEQIADTRLPDAIETYHLRGLSDDKQLFSGENQCNSLYVL